MHATDLADDDEADGALLRLLTIAEGDTHQSAYVANFLLAWWNARNCGGFDLTDLWGVDSAISCDMVRVMGFVARRHNYPTTYGLGARFEGLVQTWRPHLTGKPRPSA
ncbi:hypothetical protein LPC08_25475 (plasmid) [Roseomonas sp. OT10]|uniref:DUF7673 family protein n=1 Tax=Roseomonas cutis TaxID=2897332 RepID=UPI001E3811A9|nr:hypothetical protein [Roseomonas sp. OT10]UFN51612.1 hypothetical protein LPC08_25475 [Roseomonas sp. OT10]